MTNVLRNLLLAIVVVTCLNLTTTQGQSACRVSITSPLKGNNVGARGMVTGRAELLPGTYLFILAHAVGIRGYWAQGNGAAEIDADDHFELLSFYGAKEDVGLDFEVLAVVVNEETRTKLDKWFDEGAKSGFQPIPLPNVVPGCSPVRVVVRKNSH